MCGIAGYISSKTLDDSIIISMAEALFHRGPDSSGFYRSGNYSAGMRRLMINDLSTGDQPLFNEDKSIVVFYNGEIYNYPELKKELIQKGHSFYTSSDGEVIAHLYEEYDELLFEKIDGMFAVAIWDEKRKKLILGRDIPGEKPLYYSSLSSTEIVFSSEIKSISKFPIDKSLNLQAIWDYPTFLWIPEPDTIYTSVKALPPSHYLTVDASGTKLKSYNNNFAKDIIINTEEDALKYTRNIVESCIKSRLLSDVPVGSFLSGGLDSSIVSTIAAKNIDSLSTFTIGFDDLSDPYHGKADESMYAEQYAKKLGSKHHTIRVTANDFLVQLNDLALYGDQPFAVSSGLGILAISKAARSAGIKVLLTGDGADECFGGYSWYFYLKNKAGLPHKEADCENVSFQNFGRKLEDRLKCVNSYSDDKQAWAWHYYASETEKRNIFNPELFSSSDSSLRWFKKNQKNKWEADDFINHDREFYFPNEMLKKADRMTMAHSVEGRAPFAAPAILNLAAKLKFQHKIKNDQLKWVLREAFKDLLPEDITSRPKHGFNVPIDHWLKNEWSFLVNDTFSKDSELYKRGIIHDKSYNFVLSMLNDTERLNGHSVFTLIMLNIWLQQNK